MLRDWLLTYILEVCFYKKIDKYSQMEIPK